VLKRAGTNKWGTEGIFMVLPVVMGSACDIR
jgi:hypothetical protein